MISNIHETYVCILYDGPGTRTANPWNAGMFRPILGYYS